MKHRRPVAAVANAFTLVEMLVSIAVLIVLVGFISFLVNSASSVTKQSGMKMDSDSQVRALFDRMADDFASMLRRSDADYIFAKQAGNDTMYFYSQAPAYFDSELAAPAKNPVSLVGYRINSAFQLERLSRGLTWDGVAAPGSVVFLTPSGSTTPLSASTIAGNWASTVGNPPNYSDGTGSEYHVVGDQVYRLEVSFLQSSGAVSSSVTSYTGLQNVSAIAVAIGMLDRTSRVIVAPDGQIPPPTAAQMIAALPESIDGTATLQTWKASAYLTNSGIPQTAAGQLRIYERLFYLNTQ